MVKPALEVKKNTVWCFSVREPPQEHRAEARAARWLRVQLQKLPLVVPDRGATQFHDWLSVGRGRHAFRVVDTRRQHLEELLVDLRGRVRAHVHARAHAQQRRGARGEPRHAVHYPDAGDILFDRLKNHKGVEGPSEYRNEGVLPGHQPDGIYTGSIGHGGDDRPLGVEGDVALSDP